MSFLRQAASRRPVFLRILVLSRIWCPRQRLPSAAAMRSAFPATSSWLFLAPGGADVLVRHVPDGHAVGRVAELVMVGHRADAPDGAGFQHAGHARHDLFGVATDVFGNGTVRFRAERQARLGGGDDAAIEFIGNVAHASNLKPTKNSSSFGMS
jgi:hypothetical protein